MKKRLLKIAVTISFALLSIAASASDFALLKPVDLTDPVERQLMLTDQDETLMESLGGYTSYTKSHLKSPSMKSAVLFGVCSAVLLPTMASALQHDFSTKMPMEVRKAMFGPTGCPRSEPRGTPRDKMGNLDGWPLYKHKGVKFFSFEGSSHSKDIQYFVAEHSKCKWYVHDQFRLAETVDLLGDMGWDKTKPTDSDNSLYFACSKLCGSIVNWCSKTCLSECFRWYGH